MTPIYFWSKGEEQYRYLSNFHPCTIIWKNQTFSSAEHLYQSLKFTNPLHWEEIQNIRYAGDARKYAHHHKSEIRPDFITHRHQVMYLCLQLKFQQNHTLGIQLLTTEKRELIHYAPWDAYWGTGRNGEGENWLGKLLMNRRKAMCP